MAKPKKKRPIVFSSPICLRLTNDLVRKLREERARLVKKRPGVTIADVMRELIVEGLAARAAYPRGLP
jgi:hypothetical protein